MPEPRSIPASFSVGALEEAVSRDLLDLRFEHGLLDSDIDYIRKSCVLRWVELAADVSAYNVAAALSQPFERVRLLLGHYKTNSAPYVPSRRPHNWGLQ